MKKYVLSAVVTGLLVVPSVYAMDDGAAAAVEVPAVELDVATDVVELGTVTVAEVPVDCECLAGSSEHDELMTLCGTSEDMNLDDKVVDMGTSEGTLVDENGHPMVMYTFGHVDGDDSPQAGSVSDGTVDPQAEELAAQSGVVVEDPGNLSDGPTRSHDNIQPNYRGGINDRNFEVTSAPVALSATVSAEDPNPQLLNDEQRGAVRGLRSEEESTKPRSGLGKLFSKFRKPKSQVTLASATTTDKAFSTKLAQIDRMRDTALRAGDQKSLAKADKLERELRGQSGKAANQTHRRR